MTKVSEFPRGFNVAETAARIADNLIISHFQAAKNVLPFVDGSHSTVAFRQRLWIELIMDFLQSSWCSAGSSGKGNCLICFHSTKDVGHDVALL